MAVRVLHFAVRLRLVLPPVPHARRPHAAQSHRRFWSSELIHGQCCHVPRRGVWSIEQPRPRGKRQFQRWICQPVADCAVIEGVSGWRRPPRRCDGPQYLAPYWRVNGRRIDGVPSVCHERRRSLRRWRYLTVPIRRQFARFWASIKWRLPERRQRLSELVLWRWWRWWRGARPLVAAVVAACGRGSVAGAHWPWRRPQLVD